MLEKNATKCPSWYKNENREYDWPGLTQLIINVKNQIESNLMITRILCIIHNNRDKTPLASQVDILDNMGKDQLNSVRQDAGSEPGLCTRGKHWSGEWVLGVTRDKILIGGCPGIHPAPVANLLGYWVDGYGCFWTVTLCILLVPT